MDDADPGTQRTSGIQKCPKLMTPLFQRSRHKKRLRISQLTATQEIQRHAQEYVLKKPKFFVGLRILQYLCAPDNDRTHMPAAIARYVSRSHMY